PCRFSAAALDAEPLRRETGRAVHKGNDILPVLERNELAGRLRARLASALRLWRGRLRRGGRLARAAWLRWGGRVRRWSGGLGPRGAPPGPRREGGGAAREPVDDPAHALHGALQRLGEAERPLGHRRDQVDALDHLGGA